MKLTHVAESQIKRIRLSDESLGLPNSGSTPKINLMIKKDLLQLAAIVICVALAVVVTTVWHLYGAAFDEQRARLIDIGQNQTRMIEAIARFGEKLDWSSHPVEADATALGRITESLKRSKGIGKTGEINLAWRAGENIEFLLSHRHSDSSTPSKIPWKSELAEPMRRALNGMSGTIISRDYRDVAVLAAYQPVAALSGGIVAKIDMSEIREPFVKASAVSAGSAFFIILIGMMVFRRISAPIVERANKGQELREQAHRYALAAEGTNDGIWDWKIQSSVIHHSSRYAEILGYDESKDGTYEESFEQNLHPDDRDRVKTAIEAHFYERAPYSLEFRLRHKSGDYIWVQATGQATWDENGEPIYMAGSIREITNLKRAEFELRESEVHYREALENAPQSFIVMRQDGVIKFANQAAVKMFRAESSEQFTDQNHLILLHPDCHEAVNARRKRISEGLPQPIVERTRVRFDGTEFASESSGSVCFWDGEPAILITINDITDLKRVELQLLESDAQLRLVTNAIPVQIIYVDLDERAQFANLAYSEWIGVPQDEIIGMHLRDLHGEEIHNETAHYRDQTLAGETTSNEGKWTQPNGKSMYYHATRVPHFDANGNVLGIFAIFVDITDLRDREDQLRQSQKLETVGRLTGGVAHDFNNLLAATMINAQLLEFKLEDRPDLVAMAGAIVKTAKRGAELTHRLLAFSRQQTLQPVSVDLGALCEGMHDLLKRSLGEIIEIEFITNLRTWNVLADPGQVENALLNLAINASHAMPDGGGLTIKVENAPLTSEEWIDRWGGTPGDYVALRVIDQGTGMSEDVLDHVFEPFFTTKDVGQGSGLGLSMVHGFARKSGGFVTIQTIEGEGTTVSIYLLKAENHHTVSEISETVTELRKGQGEIILLVEDEPAVREATANLLEMLGYKILVAEDGASATELASNAERIDLLLTDMVLPGGMNGADIYRQIRKKRPNLKYLFMSGYTSLPDLDLPEGAEIIPKPVPMEALAEKMRNVLEA